ncbi:MAG: adenylosuccinate synthetase [Candidatus Competibacteraceae bacterium]
MSRTPSKPTPIYFGRTPSWNTLCRGREALSGCHGHGRGTGGDSGSTARFRRRQGLLLDQDRGCFPHVTRSNTGLRNVLALADELGLERLDVTYVTRAYLTRHGAGPLPRERPEKPYPGIVDTTNVPNEHRSTLRFAWLDLDLLGRAIHEDLSDAAHPALTVNAGLAITCLDQLDGEAARYYRGGIQHRSSLETFVAAATEAVGLDRPLLGFGPSGELMPCG